MAETFRIYVWSRRDREWQPTSDCASEMQALVPAGNGWLALGFPKYEIREMR